MRIVSRSSIVNPDYPHAANHIDVFVDAVVCLFVYGFYGAYNCSGLVRQVSGFSNVVSVRRVHVVLWTAGF